MCTEPSRLETSPVSNALHDCFLSQAELGNEAGDGCTTEDEESSAGKL